MCYEDHPASPVAASVSDGLCGAGRDVGAQPLHDRVRGEARELGLSCNRRRARACGCGDESFRYLHVEPPRRRRAVLWVS